MRTSVAPIAVVPVKNLVDAKQRLSPMLNPVQRRGLYHAMLRDVLCTLTEVTRLQGIVLVTQDPMASELAREFGADVLSEPDNQGHSVAVTRAAQALATQSVNDLLQVPGDVPLVLPADIDALLDAHQTSPAVTICPSLDRRGSNALLCSPPDVMPFQFGNDSFKPHLAGARTIGIEPVVVERHALALDVDTPDDLKSFMATESDTNAWRYVKAHI